MFKTLFILGLSIKEKNIIREGIANITDAINNIKGVSKIAVPSSNPLTLSGSVEFKIITVDITKSLLKPTKLQFLVLYVFQNL
jgi:hypothetical protein